MHANDVHIVVNKVCETPLLDISSAQRDISQAFTPLSPRSKHTHLTHMLERDPALFLEKYGKFLSIDELNLFSSCSNLQDNYEVKWHLQVLVGNLNTSKASSTKQLVIKNRRYWHMQKLIKEGDYFSDESIQKRYPYLYYEYVGKYQPQKKYAPDMPLHERLMDNMEFDRVQKMKERQQEKAENAIEEVEDSDEEDSTVEEEPSDVDKEELRQQLLDEAFNKFLKGEDADFDYTKVDEDQTLDWTHDQEEDSKYFSDEDS